MSADLNAIRNYLKKFDFSGLFTQELGWDNFRRQETLAIGETGYHLQGVAEKHGVQIYHCLPGPDGKIPSSDVRAKLERELTKIAREHLVIFSDAAQTEQLWLYTRRDPGRPARFCPYRFHTAHANTSLIQKLAGITFTLSDEETLSLLDVTTRLKANLDKDKLTKTFYKQFSTEQKAFQAFIKGIPDDDIQRWYAAVLINRVMFLYFLQEKGFLAGNQRYLQSHLESDSGNYYADFLCPLFFEALAKSESDPTRPAQYRGKIPYLNGGIFQQHQIEASHGKSIKIDNAAFTQLFEFFDGWRWHLDERPTGEENEINPDVLGYIFEKYINQKQMGAYYTKEDITGYISRNTIIPFLFDVARKECRIAFENLDGPTVWDLLRDDPDRYIYKAVRHGISWDVHTNQPLTSPAPVPDDIAIGIDTTKPDLLERRKQWNKPAPAEAALPTEIWREVIARRQRHDEIRQKLRNGEVRNINDLITLNLDIEQFAQDVIAYSGGPELVRAFWKAIVKITVLDPTCGSGAFLFAALNILEPLYEQCLTRMQELLDDLAASGKPHRPEKFSDFRDTLARVYKHPSREYFVYKSIVLNNLYGVDIMEEATEICKLRLFLKLAAQVEPDTAKDNLGIEPLPDIDFNIRAGNTLVGYATLGEVRKAIVQGDMEDLFRQQQVDEIETKAADTQQLADNFRKAQTEGNGSVPSEHKTKLNERISELAEALNQHLAADYGIDLNTKVGQKEYQKWLGSHEPFHWFTEFYGIMADGGFSVIIGNPPYVEYRVKSSSYSIRQEDYETAESVNLYGFTMERSSKLLTRYGFFGMIVPTGLLGLDETHCVRLLLTKRFDISRYSTYAIRPAKLFEGVDQRLCIYVGASASTSSKVQTGKSIFTSKYHHWYNEERPYLLTETTFSNSTEIQRIIRIPQQDDFTAGLINKLEAKQEQLIANYFASKHNGHKFHYHRSPRYWIRSTDFEQYFKSASRQRSIHHFRDLHFKELKAGKFMAGLLNSSLFFLWFVSVGNARNITGKDVENFPVGTIDQNLLNDAAVIFDRLMDDYRSNSIIRKRQDCEFQEFRQSLSKSLIDEIDKVLAKHYGFTDEELDFIINYDIKYRMGRDNGSDE